MEADYPKLRGIYSQKEEKVATFANGVPIFDTVEECRTWMELHSQVGSNPEDPTLHHIFTHLKNWDQVQRFLIHKLRILRPKPPKSKPTPENENDKAENKVRTNPEFKPVLEALRSRLQLPFHREVNVEASLNTLKYCFFHMRSGIFVCIRDNEIKMFAPFVNKDYRNNWGHLLRTDPPSLEEYYEEKRNHYRKENIIMDKSQWWANGNIICNEHSPPGEKYTQWWGDNLLSQLKHMFETLCRERKVPDVEFFLNKRDHPQLKANLTEPYDFLYDKVDQDLDAHKYPVYAPILSFYCSDKFADIPCPTTEDWESTVGKVFPPSFIKDKRNALRQPRDLYLETNFKKFHVDWTDKTNTAFFRGNATGSGTSHTANQRINAAYMCKKWEANGSNYDKGTSAKVPLLNAGITGFNVRDKKRLGEPMTFTRRDEIGVEKADFIPMYEQGKFKYILYIDGHCAANRYSFLMRLGSVILKVESLCEASEMWYFPLLKPYTDGDVEVDGADHVPVKADLSDLREKIIWCRTNDDKCKQIAENAKARWQRCLSREPLLDYLQVLCKEIASKYRHPPAWYTMPDDVGDPLKLEPFANLCDMTDRFNPKLCARCKELEATKDKAQGGSTKKKQRLGK